MPRMSRASTTTKRSGTVDGAWLGTQHFLSVRKLKRDRDEVIIRSSLAAIHSYLAAYDRVSPATNRRVLIEVQCPHRDGELVIFDGVTRATRVAKYCPGALITVEVTGDLNGMVGDLPTVGERL